MASRELIVLGTAAQAPTRDRAHNAYALRWDDQLLLFDPGEGTQRQCLLARVSIARLTAVCITHFHGDHSLGLAGVIQRRALDNPGSRDDGHGGSDRGDPGDGTADAPGLPPLPVCFPADGRDYFERLRASTIFHDTSGVEPVPISGEGPILRLGDHTLSARALDHRVTTYGYRLEEPDRVHFDPAALSRAGVHGPDVGRLAQQGWLDVAGGRVTVDEVSVRRTGQSAAFVMDTAPCDAALDLARGVDLLVCESTFLHRDVDLAARYTHLTARQAAELAVEAGARRLVLTHFSARYPDSAVFAAEAAVIHSDVVVASDLTTVEVPRR